MLLNLTVTIDPAGTLMSDLLNWRLCAERATVAVPPVEVVFWNVVVALVRVVPWMVTVTVATTGGLSGVLLLLTSSTENLWRPGARLVQL